jgi:hypothetical protein
MEKATLEELHAQLARLQAEEAKLSAVRDRLHHQIDFGFGSEATRDREREISDERQDLHRRIDALRAQLRAQELV